MLMESSVTIGFLLVGIAMLSAVASQFFAVTGRQGPRPVAGYWFRELTRTGRVLLAASWVLGIFGLFVAMKGWGFI